jgi:two-component system secretion response regulator SsrB
MNPVTVAVVEDQSLFRSLLIKVLKGSDRYRCIGDAADANAGWELCNREKPEVVLLDLQMPGGGGIALGAKLRQAHPEMRLLALTALKDSVAIDQVARTGFHGYVEKDQPFEVVEEAIQTVAAGRVWFSPFFEQARRQAAADPDDWRKILSPREQEVLSLIGNFRTNEMIAEKLGLSQRTVETHRYNIMRKLNIEEAASLIRYAIEHGFSRPSNS